VVARAQQGDRVRRIGVLIPQDENDPDQKRRYFAFTQALADLGWTDGRNVRIDPRWASGDIDRMRALAHELVGLQPDIILALNSSIISLPIDSLAIFRQALGDQHAELADRFVKVRSCDDIGEDHHFHGKFERAQPWAQHLYR
jgi:hypothetical protein